MSVHPAPTVQTSTVHACIHTFHLHSVISNVIHTTSLLIITSEIAYVLQGGSARHLYVVCICGAICLQIQKYFPPDPAIFSPKNKILILLYIVYRFMQNISIFHGKTARYDVLKIDISHHRYKPRRDIESSHFSDIEML